MPGTRTMDSSIAPNVRTRCSRKPCVWVGHETSRPTRRAKRAGAKQGSAREAIEVRDHACPCTAPGRAAGTKGRSCATNASRTDISSHRRRMRVQKGCTPTFQIRRPCAMRTLHAGVRRPLRPRNVCRRAQNGWGRFGETTKAARTNSMGAAIQRRPRAECAQREKEG